MTLIQTLGKPLNGTVSAHSSLSGASAQSLPLTVAGPPSQTGGPPLTLQTIVEIPAGALPPKAGSAVVLNALPAGSKGGSTSPTLSITVSGAPLLDRSVTAEHALRQSSLAPLFADLVRIPSGAPLSQGLDIAIEKLLGFTIKADGGLTAQNLQKSVEAALGSLVRPGLATSGAPTTAVAQTSLNGALGALVRALGLVQAHQQIDTVPKSAATPTTPSAQQNPQAAAKPAPTPLPVQPNQQPSRLVAHPVPTESLDVSDPAVLQALKSKAEAATSRQILLQSLDPSTLGRGSDAQTLLRADVPMMLGQEAAVLGITIDQESQGKAKGRSAPHTWRFRFAFESRAIGGLEGLIALRQPPATNPEPPQTDIAVWASDPDLLSALKRSQRGLIEALAEMGLEITSLTISSLSDMPKPEVAASREPNKNQGVEPPHYVDLSS